MKKVVLAYFLACVAIVLGLPSASASAQTAAPAASATAPCQMADAEYTQYNAAITQTDPKARAAAIEAYLTAFPKSSCPDTKLSTLDQLMLAYYAFDHAKAIDAADRVLQLNPTQLDALTIEALFRREAAESLTDPAAKQAAMDTAASYAQKALTAPKSAGMTDAAYKQFQDNAFPALYSAIGYDALLKKDSPAAIDAFKKELASVPVAQTEAPGQYLQDTFYLGNAYYESQPPDYLDCAFYAARAANFAPDNFKAQMTPTAKYCYHKYHGNNDDQWNQLVTLAAANLNPPANLATTITPAPTTAQIIAGILQSTPPDQLATSDKEYILQNGTPDQVSTVWNSMKGKSFQFPDVLVIALTPQQVQVAISDDAVQAKTADFTFNMTPPEPVPDLPAHATAVEKTRHERAVKKAADDAAAIAAATAPGQKVTLSGTFDSFTPKPFMINMTDGAVILPEATKPAAKPAVHHTAAKKK